MLTNGHAIMMLVYLLMYGSSLRYQGKATSTLKQTKRGQENEDIY